MKNDNAEHSVPKEVITYAAGAVEAKLAEIARNSNQPESELRQWVAIFLLTSWEGLSNSMPPVRGKATRLYSGTRKMAMVNNTHLKPSKKPSNSSHPVSKNKGRKYKPGTHWTQKPENKAKLQRVAKARYHKLAA